MSRVQQHAIRSGDLVPQNFNIIEQENDNIFKSPARQNFHAKQTKTFISIHLSVHRSLAGSTFPRSLDSKEWPWWENTVITIPASTQPCRTFSLQRLSDLVTWQLCPSSADWTKTSTTI